MSDITKCKGTNCPLKNTCYRYISATNLGWQAWLIDVPFKEDNTCELYWKTNEQTKQLQKYDK